MTHWLRQLHNGHALQLAVVLALIGLGLLIYSARLPRYTDEAEFNARVMRLEMGQSEAYQSLRDQMLTSKFLMQDYGVTLLVAALTLAAISRNKQGVKSPRSIKALLALALLLPWLTVAASVFDLMQAYDRGEFPYWADSLSIPLAGAPIIGMLLTAWSFTHWLLWRSRYQPGVSLLLAWSRQTNKWLLIVMGVNAVLVIELAREGAYWFCIPGVAWLYFYCALAVSWRGHHSIARESTS